MVVLAFVLCSVIAPNYAQGSQRLFQGLAPVATNGEPFPWNMLRLPDTVIPAHYHLLVHPNLTTLNFSASVRIEVDVMQSTDFIILHSKDLLITKAIIEEETGASQSRKPLQVLEYPPHEQIALVSSDMLLPGGKYFICIDYAANLSDGFYGFYKSTYRSKDGETR